MSKSKPATPPAQPSSGENYASFIKSYAQGAGKRREAELGDLDTQIEMAGRLIPALLSLEAQYAEPSARQRMGLERDLAPEYYSTQRELQGREYANIAKLAPQLKAAVTDPRTEAIREELGRQVQDELGLGAQLDPELAREIQQGVRGAQTARGLARGTGAISAEALMTGVRAEELRRHRQAAASQFLNTQAATAFDPLRAMTGRSSTTQQFNPAAAMPGNFAGVASMTPSAMAMDQKTNMINSINQWNAQQVANQQNAEAYGSAQQWLSGDALNLTGVKQGGQRQYMSMNQLRH